jgi:ubiquinone/menaquinone biosynthesis C-methylase UbiE
MINLTRAKSALRATIRSTMWKGTSLAVSAFKYLPYEASADSYVITNDTSPKLETEKFATPPQSLRFGYDSDAIFLESGAKDTDKMLDILKGSDFSLGKGNRILDLGCCTGRMTRHLEPYAQDCEIWGTDIDSRAVYWCKQNLTSFNFATTTTIPHLPFEDQYFDLIYTGSVLTHIDDLAEAWLLEIRRILKPSGRFYVTIHDQHTVQLLETTRKDHPFSAVVRSFDLYQQHKHDFQMLVLGRDTVSQVFYDIDYFCQMVKPMYNVLSINQEAYGYQTALLLMRT